MLVGTAPHVADEMQAWFEAGAADGFNVAFNYHFGPFDDFCMQVVPE